MGWRDTLRSASFRGVAFKVEAHDAKFGRRQATHEFAERDEPFTEDLGRRAREFTVEGYLIGEDYPAQRDRMIGACETAGPAELVHPYLGSLHVECTGLAVRESSTEGGLCRISLSFIEAGQAKFPSVVDDPVRSVTAAANVAEEAAEAGFVERFFTDGFPSFVVDAAQGQVLALSEHLLGVRVSSSSDAQAVAEFFRRVRRLASDARVLVSAPAALAAEVTAIVAIVRDTFGALSGPLLRSLRAAYDVPASGPSGTPNRQQVLANADALAALVRLVALAEEAKADVLRADAAGPASADAGQDGFMSRSDAIATRDRLTDAIDSECERPSTPDATYDALNDLRTQVVQSIPSPALRLPRVVTVTPPATLPSLVVSYRFYGTAARAVEIATRNRAPHPGFLIGRQPLELLSNV